MKPGAAIVNILAKPQAERGGYFNATIIKAAQPHTGKKLIDHVMTGGIELAFEVIGRAV